MDASHSFRIRLKTYFTQKGKDKNKAPVVKPSYGTIYVAKKFPLWQSIILNNMKALYEVLFHSFCHSFKQLFDRKTIENFRKTV